VGAEIICAHLTDALDNQIGSDRIDVSVARGCSNVVARVVRVSAARS
jgi:hypothetical protein